jgi:hypothetical protein
VSTKKLYYSTVSPFLVEVLKTLMAEPRFDAFRLVGGTALSLLRGHRESVDIDLFTDAFHGTVDFDAIDSFLRERYPYVDTSNIKIVGFGKPYIIGKSKEESIKLDLYYVDEFIQQAIVVDGIRMATIEEIIAMKIDVIARGGRKKDFWDIHEVLKDYSFEQMVSFHEKRYSYTHDVDLIKRNFTDFSRADKDADPACLRGKKWELIKLDIIEFVTPQMDTITKIKPRLIKLKPNEPLGFYVNEGLDYFNTLLYLRFNASILHDKQIIIRVKNMTGEMFSTPVYFDSTGLLSFLLISSELSNEINNPIFTYIEFEAKEDMQFEFWGKDQEGGFMDF